MDGPRIPRHPRDPSDPRLCGARTRRAGALCRNFAIRPSGRCRLHGGKSRRGFGSPTFRHGWYSRCPIAQLVAEPPARAGSGAGRGDTRPSVHATDTPCNRGNLMEASENAPLGGPTGVTGAVRSRRRGRDQGPAPERVGLAAALCYRDAEPDEAIARRLGVARRTLARWKRRPDFAAATAALRALVEWGP